MEYDQKMQFLATSVHMHYLMYLVKLKITYRWCNQLFIDKIV